jgi:hypothetical protein
MAQYSLTVTRPTRIGRVSAPGSDELRSAMAGEQAMAQAMLQPGASQVIGHRFLAEQKALDARRDYTLATEQHNQTLSDMREEDRRRALEDQATRNRQALLTAGINNPAGMSAMTAPELEGLLDPNARDLYRSLLRENVTATGRRYSLRPEGSGEPSPNVAANIVQRENAMIEQSVRAARADLTRQESTIMTDATRRLQSEFNQARRQAIIQERDAAIAAARQRANDLITGLEARRGGRGGAAPTTPQGNTQQAAPSGNETVAPLETPDPRAAMLESARRHLANPSTTPQQREAIRQRLQQNGIDPDTMQ